MSRWASRGPQVGALLLLLAAPGAARRPAELVVAIEAGQRWEVDRDPHDRPLAGDAMLARAASVLSVLVGDGYPRTHTWELLQLLADPAMRAEADRLAGLADHRRVYLLLLPLDGPRGGRHRVLPGERIHVPGRGAPFQVGAEGSLEVVSRLVGVGLAPLVAENYRRFQVSPHARSERVPARGLLRARSPEGTGERTRVVRMGESRLDEFGSLAMVLLHEVAHLGQDGAFAGLEPWYGPDGAHHPDEVLPWTAAYLEGWARYQSSHLPEHVGRGVPELADLLGPLRELWVEQPEGGYRRLAPGQVRVEHLLGNEHVVARLLLAFEALAGRAAVEAAFLETKRRIGATVADLVAALRRARPELTGALRERLLLELRGADPEGMIEACLRGEVPPAYRGPRTAP